mgnify:CR=1 FL=1
MKKALFVSVKVFGITLACILLFVLLYMFFAGSFGRMVVYKKPVIEPANLTVYLLSNGAHMDIVVPVNTDVIDWSQQFKYQNTRAADSTFNYIAIGWGDKGFYMEIPTWDDLTVRIALRAGLGIGSSAIHATYYRNMYDYEGDELCRKFTITENQYKDMVNYVLGFLIFDTDIKAINIDTDALYGNYDAFYEAKKSYSIFYTCNTWTNNLLKASGQRACLWTPFSQPLLDLYN